MNASERADLAALPAITSRRSDEERSPMASHPPSDESVATIRSIIAGLPAPSAIIGTDPSGIGDNRELIAGWCIVRAWCRDGAIRLVGVEPGCSWEDAASAADLEIKSGRLARVLGLAALLDHSGEEQGVTALMALRHVLIALGDEVARRAGDRPLESAYVDVQSGRAASLDDLNRVLRIRRVVRRRRLSNEEFRDAHAEALAAIVRLFARSTEMLLTGLNDSRVMQSIPPSPFDQLGVGSPPGWSDVSQAFLLEEVRWALEDFLPILAGALQDAPRDIQTDQETTEKRELRRRRLRIKFTPVHATDLHAHPDKPDEVTERLESERRAAARAKEVQAKWPRKVWDAYLATLDGASLEDAAAMAGVSLSTFKRYKSQIRRDLMLQD
jgi:hypothetical protein